MRFIVAESPNIYFVTSLNKELENTSLEITVHKHKLKVIYDAAHAFNVRENGVSVANYGDLSILSFHATKVFSTIEGGAIISHSAEMKQHIDDLKNFAGKNMQPISHPE